MGPEKMREVGGLLGFSGGGKGGGPSESAKRGRGEDAVKWTGLQISLWRARANEHADCCSSFFCHTHGPRLKRKKMARHLGRPRCLSAACPSH